MKKVKKISIILCLILTIGVISILLMKNDKNELKETLNEKKSGMFSFMLEKKDGSGYKENSATSWPSSDDYIFNPTLSKCERGSKLKYDPKTNKVQVTASGSDRCYIYFDTYNYEKYCKYGTEDSLVCDILRKKDNTIIYHDGYADYVEQKNVNLEADDLSYRYTGATSEVNNYVCFGTDASSCPADNLYRIIGFFKNDEGKYEIKLIKADYANKNLLGSGTTTPSDTPNYSINGSFSNSVYNKTSGTDELKDAFIHRYRGSLTEVNKYQWQEIGTIDTTANWPTSLLNSIHLNYNFLGTFSKTWQDMIVDYNWHYKGSTYTNIVVGSKTSANSIRTTFDYEVGKNADKTLTEPTKIGLIYVSDYLYGASPNKWNLKPYNGDFTYESGNPDSEGNPQGTYGGDDGTDYRNAIDENWMYLGLWEWTITQRVDDSNNHAFDIDTAGIIYNAPVGTYPFAIRPTFYIKSDTKLNSGNGTKESPYRLSI